MKSAAEFRITVFLSSIAVVYILTAFALLRLILVRFGWIKPSTGRVFLWLRRVVFSLAILGVLCFAYGLFVEPYWLSIEHIEIKSAKLPKNARTIRIAQISDLHCDGVVRLETKLPTVITQQRPDLIVFTGDSLNSADGLPIFKDCLTKLAAIAPTYVVKGNNDIWHWYKLDLFGGTNAIELKGDPIRLNIDGVKLSISGIPVGSEERLNRALESTPEDFSIFLFHYPDLIKEVAAKGLDLYCAGHTHGGQIALPFYGALITLSKFDKQFEAGLYQVDKTHLYVNRGIGMEGGDTPRVRFCARPEVTIIDIKAQ